MNSRPGKTALAIALLFFFALPATASAAGSNGSLTQKTDPDGCIADINFPVTGCTTGKALNGASSVTVSPDGKSAYVASAISDAVAVFDRDTTTGALTQKTDPDGCIADINLSLIHI